MKKILITGAESYIGVSFSNYMNAFKDKYEVDTLDLKDKAWKKKSFLGYDVIFHVAGIAHIKVTSPEINLYPKEKSPLLVSKFW